MNGVNRPLFGKEEKSPQERGNGRRSAARVQGCSCGYGRAGTAGLGDGIAGPELVQPAHRENWGEKG
jgi:hypothetical protein